MRPQPQTTPPEPLVRLDPAVVSQTRHYSLITPLFGGGVVAGVNDPVTVIRGTTIRGHLRFWWRACRGGQFNGDLAAMKRAEDAIWGAASTPGRSGASAVQTAVQVTNRGAIFEVMDSRGRLIPIGNPRSPYSYVAFPLQPTPAVTVREGVQFRLNLTYPTDPPYRRHINLNGRVLDLESETAAALWAWEMFGGIGARTRRGFGALSCERVNNEVLIPAADRNALLQQLREGLSRHVTPGTWPAGVPYIPHAGIAPPNTSILLKLVGAPATPTVAWETLFAALKRFRQDRDDGPKGKGLGRSKWPEPEAIRAITGQRSQRHPQAGPQIRKFPRAAFGLPIVFSFKDAEDSRNREPDGSSGPPYDPNRAILQRRDHDRLASPLILRPLMCGTETAVGLALVLVTRQLPIEPLVPEEPLVLKHGGTEEIVDALLLQGEATQIPKLGSGQHNADVLRTFLASLNGEYV